MLAVLEHVDAISTALVRDVTAELLARDRAVDRVVHVDNKSPVAVRAAIDATEFDAALVVSNQSNVELYAELGLPIFFVDVLYWCGVRKDQPVWNLAERTFVQRFPGVTERLQSQEYRERPAQVGPLIRRATVHHGELNGTLIQIGGARSRWVRPGENSSFPRMVIDWISRQNLDWPKPWTLAGGREAGAVARQHPLADQMDIVSYPYDEFLSKLNQSELYVTTPGQGAVFEGLRADVDMLVLPPQNATQVLQLRTYEHAGLVGPGLNLTALDSAFDTSLLDCTEDQLTPEVLRSLRRIDSHEIAEIVGRHLQHQYKELGKVRSARQEFIEFLGPRGGPVVAQALSRWWGEQWM
jgi:hypothetical protein